MKNKPFLNKPDSSGKFVILSELALSVAEVKDKFVTHSRTTVPMKRYHSFSVKKQFSHITIKQFKLFLNLFASSCNLLPLGFIYPIQTTNEGD